MPWCRIARAPSGSAPRVAWPASTACDFKVFRHAENDPGSLYSNGIATLTIDQQGRLWAAGLNAGLNRYDAATGKFLHWGHDPDDAASLASDRVWAMAQSADGSFWVGSAGGLDRMRPDSSVSSTSLNPLLGSSPEDFGTVAALYVDPHQRLWIGCSKGVFVREADGRDPAGAVGPARSRRWTHGASRVMATRCASRPPVA